MIDRFLTGFIWIWLALFVAGNAIVAFAVFMSGGWSAANEVFAQINVDHVILDLLLLGPAVFAYGWRMQLRRAEFGQTLGTPSADGQATAETTAGDDDLFRTARGIVERHGDGAAAYAERMAWDFEAKGRPSGAAYWRRVHAALCEEPEKLAKPLARHHEQGRKGSKYDWGYFLLDATRLWLLVVIAPCGIWLVYQIWSGATPSVGIVFTVAIVGFLIIGALTEFLQRHEIEISLMRRRRFDAWRSKGRKGNRP